MAATRPPAWIRFLAGREILDNDCHRWLGGKSKEGYGWFLLGRDQYAHRASHVLFVGGIPAGMTIDHYRYPQDGCIGPSCVNPDHLKVATQRENILRSNSAAARGARATHCPSGHPYEAENLYVSPKGHRYCRECNRQRARANYYRAKEHAQGGTP
jgi:hypothetical protein